MKLSKKITAILMIGLISAFVAGCGEAAQNEPQPQQNAGTARASGVDESSSASQNNGLLKIKISSAYGSITSIPTSTKRLLLRPITRGPKTSIM